MGWTAGDESRIPREDVPPREFHEEKIPGDPACPAWDEPGYVDPELSHADLPLGARYWQGYARHCTTEQGYERAMSPGWVARVTEQGGTQNPPPFDPADPPDPNFYRVARDTEEARILFGPAWTVPG